MKQLGFTVYNLNADQADKTGLWYSITNHADKVIREEGFVKQSRVVELQPGETLSIRESMPGEETPK